MFLRHFLYPPLFLFLCCFLSLFFSLFTLSLVRLASAAPPSTTATTATAARFSDDAVGLVRQWKS